MIPSTPFYTYIRCPWCGEEADDSPNILPWDDNYICIECFSCHKEMTVVRDIEISYCAEKLE